MASLLLTRQKPFRKADVVVLTSPEPWVVAEALPSSVVQLRVYAWPNSNQHSWLEVRPSLVRPVKRTFQEHWVAMPDDAREVVFPEAVPVHLLRDRSARLAAGHERKSHPSGATSRPDDASIATTAEAGLETRHQQITALAQASRDAQAGKDPLPDAR